MWGRKEKRKEKKERGKGEQGLSSRCSIPFLLRHESKVSNARNRTGRSHNL
jgi:hypothetical protein